MGSSWRDGTKEQAARLSGKVVQQASRLCYENKMRELQPGQGSSFHPVVIRVKNPGLSTGPHRNPGWV